MLQINNISYHIGERKLLQGVNWVINPGKRVALIGPNGAGKTTLLRIIHGELPQLEGSLIKPKHYRIGYLPQEELALGRGPILEQVLEGYPEILALERQIETLHQRLSQEQEDEAALYRLGELESRYDSLGGYTMETQAKAILSGLGFRDEDFHRSLSDFSGGWRMRVYLARLLVQKPDLLLMDEPTNHLDLPSLEWLEQYLIDFPGSMVLVSHDRFFIDRLAQEICELEFGHLTHYAGAYHFFEKQKALIIAQREKRWLELTAERERQQKFIDRFRSKATKASQVQSRIKMLDKLEVVDIPPPPPSIHFKIKVETASYKDVMTLDQVSFRYTENWVLENVSLNLYRGDKIALVGINGAGKTTLTRLMCGELSPQLGQVTLGERVCLGYYAQHQIEALDLNATVYDELARHTARAFSNRIRDILGVFRFSGNDVYKPIRVLSGGEKARVSLAKILLSPANFLIMDEPTNHLDLASKEALEEALSEYDGTLLLIAHDRYFLDKLVKRVIEIKDSRLGEFEGNYSEYLAKRAAERANAPAEEQTESGPLLAEIPGRKSKDQKRLEAESRQAISKERNVLKKEIERIEKRIEILETQKAETEALLGNPESYKDGALAARLQSTYQDIKTELQQLLQVWETHQLAYEELLRQLQGQI